MLLKGSGLGRIRFEIGVGVVKVPDDDSDCASRGRPYVFVNIELASSGLSRLCALLKDSE